MESEIPIPGCALGLRLDAECSEPIKGSGGCTSSNRISALPVGDLMLSPDSDKNSFNQEIQPVKERRPNASERPKGPEQPAQEGLRCEGSLEPLQLDVSNGFGSAWPACRPLLPDSHPIAEGSVLVRHRT